MLTETFECKKNPSDSIPSHMQSRYVLREPPHPGSLDLLCIHPTLNQLLGSGNHKQSPGNCVTVKLFADIKSVQIHQLLQQQICGVCTTPSLSIMVIQN